MATQPKRPGAQPAAELAAVSDALDKEIIARRRAEQDLRGIEVNFRQIVDSIPGLVCTMSPAGEMELLNRQVLDFFGKPAGELKAWADGDAVHPDDLPRFVAIITNSLATGVPYDIEARCRRADGVYRWFQVRSLPVRDADARITGWYLLLTDIDDRKRAEDAIRASERDLNQIINAVPALAWSARPDGPAEFFNRHYLDYLGLPAEQARGWGWTSAVHPDDQSALAGAWRAIMTSGRPGETETRLRRFDGEYRWFLFRANPLRDGAGHILKWYGINIDIEDRKRAEAQLAGEKQLLEMIGSRRSLHDILDASCRFVERAAGEPVHCGIYGIDWSGPAFRYGVAPSLPPSYLDPIDGLAVHRDIAPCGIAAFEKRQVIVTDIGSDPRWNGSDYQRHVLAHGLRSVWSTPICASDGCVLGTFCVYRSKSGDPSQRQQDLIAQVTHVASIAIERSQADAALKRSETLLAEGQRLSQTGTFAWRVHTDEMTFSEELHRIFELDRGAAVTLDQILTRIHPEDAASTRERFGQIRAGTAGSDNEMRLLMPDNRVKYLRVMTRDVLDQNGRPERLGAIQDITERRLAEEALSKARADLAHVARITSLGVLTSSIAHEINQPLASIVTNSETGLRWLARPEPNIEKVQDLTRRVVADARRASEIIDRIRAMATQQATRQTPLSLDQMIEESMAFLRHEFQSRGISVSVDLAPALPEVTGDRTQLQQVIVNLAINAAQAMTQPDPARRSLSIRTMLSDPETVCCIFEDSGPGIDPGHLPRLFETFFTTKDSGMGMGLAISQSIIEAHGGRIRADDNSALGGARFSFALPVNGAA